MKSISRFSKFIAGMAVASLLFVMVGCGSAETVEKPAPDRPAAKAKGKRNADAFVSLD